MNSELLESLIHSQLPAAAGGDRAAYGRIVAGCQNTVSAIALAIVRDAPASEDIAQDAFLSAWQNLRRLQNPASFLPWLRQITRNLARDHLRAQKFRACPVDDVEAVIAAAADPAPDIPDSLAQAQERVIAAEIIDALPEDSRETLLLYYREGQNSKQVAALLGLSDAAVRKRLSRARQSIRGELLARLGTFARDSAPTAAFTAIVTAALTIASPPAAAAAILGTGVAVAGKTLGKLLLGALGAAAIGVLGAFVGIYLGLRRQLRGALDDAERGALTRSAVVTALASLGFVVAVTLSNLYTDGWIAPVVCMLVFIALVFYQAMVAQPRILARRHAAEAARDPEAAARRRHRERVLSWLGAMSGLVIGGGALIYGLVANGRL